MPWKDPNDPVRIMDASQRYSFSSYGANDWGLGENWPNASQYVETGLMSYVSREDDYWGVRESQVKVPQQFIAYLESNRDGDWDQLGVACLNTNGCNWCFPYESPGAIHPQRRSWGTNIGFFDGHVTWYPTLKNPEAMSIVNIYQAAKYLDGILLAHAGPPVITVQKRGEWRKMWCRQGNINPADPNMP
jgi:prepilin-type processing-associated H-X9-DG protein